jgi:hypothetical protein
VVPPRPSPGTRGRWRHRRSGACVCVCVCVCNHNHCGSPPSLLQAAETHEETRERAAVPVAGAPAKKGGSTNVVTNKNFMSVTENEKGQPIVRDARPAAPAVLTRGSTWPCNCRTRRLWLPRSPSSARTASSVWCARCGACVCTVTNAFPTGGRAGARREHEGARGPQGWRRCLGRGLQSSGPFAACARGRAEEGALGRHGGSGESAVATRRAARG